MRISFWIAGAMSAALSLSFARSAEKPGGLPIIPYPQKLSAAGGGTVRLSGKVASSDAALGPLAEILAQELHQVTGTTFAADVKAPGPGDVVLQLSTALKGEAYSIDVTDRVTVTAADYASAAMAGATLLQVVSTPAAEQPVTMPKLKIDDEPKIAYRGIMLDLARNFHSVDRIKEVIRLCHFYKLRQLQLHLSDDQSFTFPSTAYPALATPNRSYTLEQIKDMVAYATARGVQIVPEIDMPGHASSIINSMPDPFKVATGGNVIDFRKPEAVAAMGKIVDELCEAFPDSPYIHLGGDEANLGPINDDPGTPEALKAADVPDIHGLFNHFLNQMIEHVKAHGKRPIVWEGFELFSEPAAKLDASTIVMPFDNYRSVETTYIDRGYDALNTSWYPLYLVNGTPTTIKNLYDWNLYLFGNYKSADPRDPDNVTQYTVTKKDKVLGCQMSSWEQPEQAEMPSLRRRVAAMIDRAWLRTPPATPLAEFAKRLDATDARLTALLAVAAPGAVNATASTDLYPDHIDVLWPPASGYPTSYTVYRATGENFADAKPVASDLTATRWTDASARPGAVFSYWVKARNGFGESAAGEPGRGSAGSGAKIAVVYDGFPTTGDPAAVNDGTGWAGAWKINHAEGATVSIVQQGLAYPGLASSGGALHWDVTADQDGIEMQRETAAPQVAPGAETWISYLIKADRVGTGDCLVLVNNSEAGSSGKSWGRGLGLVQLPTTVAMEAGKTYLIVEQIQAMRGADVTRCWINPALGKTPAPEATTSFRDTADCGEGNTTLRMRMQHHGHGCYTLDEIRIGRSFADVTPKGAAGAAPVRAAAAADDSPSAGLAAKSTATDPLQKFRGKYVTLQFKKTDFANLKDRPGFIKMLDDAYAQMKELTTVTPVLDIRGGVTPMGVWGHASEDGIVINWHAIGDVFKDFNEHRMSFGIIHEMGHRFDGRDKPRWYITPHAGGEEFANLKLFYAADRMLRPDNNMRIDFGPGGPQTGWDWINHAFLHTADKYLADPSKQWAEMQSDDLASFHLTIARMYGWDVLKKWFRTYPYVEQAGFWAPESTDDPKRMVLECAILTHYAKADLMPLIEKWRLPVTRAEIDDAVTQYGLESAFGKVEKQYAAEVKSGAVKVDPVRPASEWQVESWLK